MERIASIDIGSNTLRLLIAEGQGKEIRARFRDREMVRLGRDFFSCRLLHPEAMEEAVKVLNRFRGHMEREKVGPVFAVGTGVLRKAGNTAAFLEKVRKEAGLSIRIISGEEEARLMAAGVLSVLPAGRGRDVIFDLGGGTTEFVFSEGGRVQEAFSLPLGVVVLTERFFKGDPPTEREINRLRDFGRTILRKFLAAHDKVNRLIGTAGTATTLAAMYHRARTYRPEEINGTLLEKGWLEETARRLLTLPFGERVSLPGLEPGRGDIIGAGISLVLEITTFFRQETLQVSDAGLLEGLILERGGGATTPG